HTYTGNPLACRAAIANLELFKKTGFFRRLNEKIDYMSSGLERFKGLEHVGDIRQMGMMAGIELVEDKLKKTPYDWEDKIGIKVINEARKSGLMLRPLGNVIVLMPQLGISREEIDRMLDVTYKSIEKVTA
ncbi:MAG: aminotransferase class III-fold pyridoxal phosphate-dependent enzyme, partial [Candidatus Omnitrophica bacterium]|nr:aminotransferase class III-fold pyridoxal phosphate-dependent enzyme [Candidatus Omnitrophota bacterium]